MKAVGCVRNYNIAHQLNKENDVLILSTSNSKGLTSPQFDLSTFSIKHIPTLDLYHIKNRSKGKRNKKSSTGTLNPSLLPRILNSFPFNISVREGGIVYILLSYFAMMKFRPEVIYSSFSPYSDHFVCYLYKLFNPKVRWITDFRDLHVDPEYDNIIWRSFQERVDQKIFGRADLLTTVSKGLAEHLYKYSNNVAVMRNGIGDKTKVIDNENTSDTFDITYTGMLYAGRRDPSVLFEVLNGLVADSLVERQDIKIVYAGTEGGQWSSIAEKYAIDDLVEDKGMVSYSESLALQRSSAINLLLSWATKEQKGILTGKFYEYLVANKPIVLVINGVEDKEFEDIFDDLNAGVVSYNDQKSKKALREYVLLQYQSWRTNKKTEGVINKEVLQNFKWSSIINTLDIDSDVFNKEDSYPLVSIVIPTYNQESYISEAINSSLAQDYPNIEILVSDDCSTDDTFNVAKRIEDSRLKVIRNENNLGRVGNYKNAMERYASGMWVLNLDGDDYLLDARYISYAMSLVHKTIGEVAFVQGRVTSNSTMGPRTESCHNVYSGRDYFVEAYQVRTFNHMTTLYNREKALKAGFYTQDILSSDAESMLRLSKYGKVILTDRVAGYWRPHGTNFTYTSSAISKFDNYNTLINSLKQNVKSNKGFISDKELGSWVDKMHIEYFLPIIFKGLYQEGFATFKELMIKYKTVGGKTISNPHLLSYTLIRIKEIFTGKWQSFSKKSSK